MGFFKKIGKFVKKAGKQISFKNLVKVGGMIDPSGLIGGLQTAHYEKKAGNEANAQMIAEQSGANAINYAQQKGLFGSAMTGAVNNYGASAIDGSINTWFKTNWQKVVISLGVIFAVIFMATRNKGTNARYGRR
jgi:Flp pilus assembly pilin Flp